MMRWRTPTTITFLAVLLTQVWTGGPARAQTAIATDRPGLSFSPFTVPAGSFQVELGTPRFEYAGSADDPAVGVDAAFRVGVIERVEARVSTTYYGRTPGSVLAGAPAHGATGMAGLRVGAKLGLRADPRVSLAVIPEIVFPVGNEELAGDRNAYSLNAAAGIKLGSAGLLLVAGAQVDPAGEEDRETTGLLLALLSHSLTDLVSGYVEVATFPASRDDAAYVGLGVSWLHRPGVQLDGFVDFGVTAAASDAVFGVGLSLLAFPF